MPRMKIMEKIKEHEKNIFLIARNGHLYVRFGFPKKEIWFVFKKSSCERYCIENIKWIFFYKNIEDWFNINSIGYINFITVERLDFNIEFKYLFIVPCDNSLEVVIK